MKTVLAEGLAVSLVILLGLPAIALAQQPTETPADAVIPSLRGLHDITMTHIMKTAEMLDDRMYAYRPTEEVRTAGQVLAHIADAQFAFCSTAAGEKSPAQGSYEETAKTKTDIIEALETGFAYCAEVYAAMTDVTGAQMRDFFGNVMAASAILAFNSAHNYEHYGNLVTYMRINGLVPPSSM